MTHRIGNVVVIEPEPAQECAYCHRQRETRPYGVNRARICHECANATPEARALTEAYMAELFR